MIIIDVRHAKAFLGFVENFPSVHSWTFAEFMWRRILFLRCVSTLESRSQALLFEAQNNLANPQAGVRKHMVQPGAFVLCLLVSDNGPLMFKGRIGNLLKLSTYESSLSIHWGKSLIYPNSLFLATIWLMMGPFKLERYENRIPG